MKSYGDPDEVCVFPSAGRSTEEQARTLDLHTSGAVFDLGENAGVYIIH